MGDEWVETTLGALANFINGYPFKPAELTGRGLPVIRIKQLLDPAAETDYSDVGVPERAVLSDGDLVFSWSGTLASRLWDRGPALLNQHLFRVEQSDGVLRKWLHYALDAAVVELNEKTHGTTMKHVTKGVLEGHPISLPPLSVQARIVDLVEHLDTLIANLERERDAAEGFVRALRAETFTGLDAPTVEAAALFDMLLGRQKSARQSVGSHVIPYVRAANITQRGMRLSDLMTMNFSPSEQQKYGLKAGDILLVEGGSIGLAARWSGDTTGTVGFDKHVIRIRAKDGRSISEYALQWCHWSRETGAFSDKATGITIPALGFGRASRMPVPGISVADQIRTMAPLARGTETVFALQSEIAAVSALRSRLLSSLLSREIEIPHSYDELLGAAS